jgi:hypothetical protein
MFLTTYLARMLAPTNDFQLVDRRHYSAALAECKTPEPSRVERRGTRADRRNPCLLVTSECPLATLSASVTLRQFRKHAAHR